MSANLDFNPSELKPVEELSYEQAFSELESVVGLLENSENSLEIILILYERGQALARHCTELLDQAELKVQQISGDDLVDFSL